MQNTTNEAVGSPTLQDLSVGQSRQLQLLELLESLARATNEARTPEDAMRTCLAKICAHGNWTLGRLGIYRPGQHAGFPEHSLWHPDDTTRFESFIAASLELRNFRSRGGFISIVAREKTPVWISDIACTSGFGRGDAAISCGLRSAFAFPVIVQNEIAAFMEFYGDEPRELDRPLLDKIGSVGSQLARLIERSRAEAAYAHLAAIVEFSQDAIVSTSADRSIQTWNAGAVQMFGYQASEVLGRDVSMLIPEERRDEIGQRRAIALAGQFAEPHETERLAKDGRRLQVSISASPLQDSAGNITGIALIYRDISKLQQAQHELERKARLSELLESLARATNEAHTPEDAMRVCLARICAHGDWALGRLGVYGPHEYDRFPEKSLWYPEDTAPFELFVSASLDRKFYSSTGRFVSVVINDKSTVWLADIADNSGFGRAGPAAACGLHSAFAFPVIVRNRVAAFMEFYGTEAREPDQRLLDAIASVGAQLARLIERSSAEAVQAQLAAIVENSEDAIFSRDLNRNILTWNDAAEKLFGYSATEIIGKHISLLVPPDQVELATQVRKKLMLGQSVPPFDTVRLTKGGGRIEVSLSQSPIRDAAGRIVAASLIFRDISARKRAEEKIRQLAHYDNLTGLPNRALLYDRLERAIRLAKREHYEVALMFIDLDRFKSVNDTLGHAAGDELLKIVAERIQGRLRASDTVARIGGDEFLAILPKIPDRGDVTNVATKILDTLSSPFKLGSTGQTATIGASIGIAIYPADAEEVDALVKAADRSMYEAKQTMNSFRFYSASTRQTG